MEIRNLGSQGLRASALGLGCMGMSEFYGAGNDKDSTDVIHRAFDKGITFFDTADVYGPHTNEVLVGKAVKAFRKEITLATKFGIVRNQADPMARGLNGSPEYVLKSCDSSLKRLNTDFIDLYYLHRADPVTSIEETVGAMSDLVRQGKVRGLGLSEVSASTLRRAHKVHPISALQTEYSLWSREPEEEIIDTCKELGIAFVPYSPLGRGFLTGQIKKFEDLEADDFRRNSPRFQGTNFQKNLDLVKRLQEFAQKKGCSASQLALAWVLSHGRNMFPIPGTKRVKYLDENIGALKITLSKDELTELDQIAPVNAASGARYHEASMKTLNG